MNSVFISGLIKGEAVAVPAKVKQGEAPKPDNTVRTVSITDTKGQVKEFKLFAYAGEMADKLAGIASGKRIILDGRIASEILEAGSEVYQGVIALRRIVAITEAMNGTDVAVGTVGGTATCEALRFTQSGSAIANLNIKNVRTFTTKKGEPVSNTTYINAVAWTEKAQQLPIPMNEVQVAVTGMLVPSEYESTKHAGAKVSKIEVWVDEFVVAGAAAEGGAPAPRPAPRPAASRPARGATKGSDDGIGF